MATGSGPRQKQSLVLRSLAKSTPEALPAQSLSFALEMALVPQSLALAMRSMSPVLKSLALSLPFALTMALVPQSRAVTMTSILLLRVKTDLF